MHEIFILPFLNTFHLSIGRNLLYTFLVDNDLVRSVSLLSTIPKFLVNKDMIPI